MSRVEEIENAVAELPREDPARFREWFAGFEARIWDRELEEDAAAGRLDDLAEPGHSPMRSRGLARKRPRSLGGLVPDRRG